MPFLILGQFPGDDPSPGLQVHIRDHFVVLVIRIVSRGLVEVHQDISFLTSRMYFLSYFVASKQMFLYTRIDLRFIWILGDIVVIIKNQLHITINLIFTSKMIIAFSNVVDEALVFHVEIDIHLRIKCTTADTINMTGALF